MKDYTAYHKIYYKQHRESLLLQSKAYYQTHKTKWKNFKGKPKKYQEEFAAVMTWDDHQFVKSLAKSQKIRICEALANIIADYKCKALSQSERSS